MTPIQKILSYRHHATIQTIGFIFSLPILFLVGIHLAKWVV